GTTSLQMYGREKKSPTARFKNSIGYYDVFNTAMFLTKEADSVAFYHKSKLVPLVESMPYPSVVEALLGGLIIDLGGTSGGLGKQADSEVFRNKQISVAPIICYESIYGAYVASYTAKGAGILCIITNDAWWGDTPGYRQHWQFAKLRAIETRRSVARSANTGLSGFINQKGEEIQKTKYWTRDVRKEKLKANLKTTFYTWAGDFLGVISTLLFPLLLIYVVFRKKNTL
ncbi:MAG: apolipoprotein N-acyltransferase, partial [Thermonemataceae bacterium]|nr:apolipoprotein N-acyltransferase [Thermonemataceae bacterium]